MSTFTDTEPYPQSYVPHLLTDTWRRHQSGEKPESTGPDGFPIYSDSATCTEQTLLSDFIRETHDRCFMELDPKQVPSGRVILNLDPAGKVRVVLAALERLPWFWKTGVKQSRGKWFKTGWEYDDPPWRWNFQPLLSALLRVPPPFSVEQLSALLAAIHEPPHSELMSFVSPKTIIRIVRSSWTSDKIPQPVLAGLKRLEETLRVTHWQGRAEDRRVLEELAQLNGKPSPPPVEPGEAWSDAAVADLGALPTDKRLPWDALLRHCLTAQSSAPAKKWLKTAGELVASIGVDDFKQSAAKWFALVALPRPVHQETRHPHSPDPDLLISEHNATTLKGLAWSCSGLNDPVVSRALSELAEVCFKKVRWLGPRCPRVGNACLYSLSVTKSDDAAAQLSRLDSAVKQPTAKRHIGKSLTKAAALTGQTKEDLEEKSVPTFGLTQEGRVTRVFNGRTAEIHIVDSRTVEVTWRKEGGKTSKSVPAEVKRSQASELKELQRLVMDMEKMLAAQRIRVERLLMTEREWEYEAWAQRYLDQPLMAPVTRRLIWHFRSGEQAALGAWLKDGLVDVQGRALDWLGPETRVRLWHPIGFPVESVAAWRCWLETHEICQPFKQAHREVYLLTDAELQTATYSNRFAAHVIGQHQFAALARQRGWKYAFMGGFDFHNTPTLELPAWNLAAEFWVNPAGEMGNTGVARYLSTDQVRFLRGGEVLPLHDVPSPVFTEVMRDVDLFVGVCSIGNDPAWQDSGELEAGADYWRNFSFGDLSASAQTRRDVLERLLPKLKIASQCTLESKFLIVRGALRTYKIHLGSGNILMEPNDQYLCIVPERGGASARFSEEVFLPFEGDGTLSIILSKAFLLAQDSRIKDGSILRQIKS